MQGILQTIAARYKKPAVVDVKSGDTVKVYQEIVEGTKKRVQMFEGLVIRTDRAQSLTSSITIRKVASGVGVEKTYLLHAPNVQKIEVVKRSKVRRNYLSYMRNRSGKSARLTGKTFDRDGVNTLPVAEVAPVAEAVVATPAE